VAIKNKLLEVRLELGYKFAKDFAEFIGIHKDQYSRYENNKAQPTLAIAYKIAKKINKPIEYFIYDNEES